MAKVKAIRHIQDNVELTLSSPITRELSVAQSLAHNGICLTITSVNGDEYTVTAMRETILRTNLGELQVGDLVNIERSMPANGRFDGHIVQGHVDLTARCTRVVDDNGSWRFYFEYDASAAPSITVPKGSISINGVSLTVVDSQPGMFSVAIIPYTYQVTNFHNFREGTVVNIEFDVFGKYVQRLLEQYVQSGALKA